MRFAGSVNLAEETFGAVAHEVALSAISAGFKNVVLMCDHGGKAQSQLDQVAKSLTAEWAPKGVDCCRQIAGMRGIPQQRCAAY